MAADSGKKKNVSAHQCDLKCYFYYWRVFFIWMIYELSFMDFWSRINSTKLLLEFYPNRVISIEFVELIEIMNFFIMFGELKKNTLKWDEKYQHSFDKLKELLVSAPILGYPKDDGLFVLDADASDVGIGAVLSQIQNDKEVVISYGSRALSQQERNYCVTRKELLAIVHHVKVFKDYLLGKHFKVRTDHWSLKYLKRFKEPEGQLARWLDFLQPFDFEIITRAGVKHGNADALSRKEVTCGGKKCQCQKFREFEYEVPVNLEIRLQRDIGIQVGEGFTEKEVGVRATQVIKCTDSGSFNSDTSRKLGQDQANDPDIGPVYRFIESGTEKPNWSTVSNLSSDSKRLIWEWGRLHIHEGILFRKWESTNGQKCWDQLILPMQYRDSVLEQLHDSVTGATLDFTKLWLKFRQGFSGQKWERTSNCGCKPVRHVR